MSGAGRIKEGRIGAGYGRYFARPSNAVRSLVAAILDFTRDRRAARDQRRRDVQPRIERSIVDSLLRVFTTVISRHVLTSDPDLDRVHGLLAGVTAELVATNLSEAEDHFLADLFRDDA